MNRNLFKFVRDVYTALDWIGNLGGLYDGLRIFFGFCVVVCNYNYYRNYMISNLFKCEMTIPLSQQGLETFNTSQSQEIRKVGNMNPKKLNPFK